MLVLFCSPGIVLFVSGQAVFLGFSRGFGHCLLFLSRDDREASGQAGPARNRAARGGDPVGEKHMTNLLSFSYLSRT